MLPVEPLVATEATIKFKPGLLPEIRLNGTPEPNFAAALHLWIDAFNERRVRGSEKFDRKKPVTIPKTPPPHEGVWRFKFELQEPVLTICKTDVPLVACLWAVLSYASGKVRPIDTQDKQ